MARRASWVNQLSLSDPYCRLLVSETRQEWGIVLVQMQYCSRRFDGGYAINCVCKWNSSNISWCYGGSAIASSGQGRSATEVHTTRIGRRDIFLPSDPPRRIIAHAWYVVCRGKRMQTIGVVAPLTPWLHITSEGGVSWEGTRSSVTEDRWEWAWDMSAGGLDIHWRMNDLVCRCLNVDGTDALARWQIVSDIHNIHGEWKGGWVYPVIYFIASYNPFRRCTGWENLLVALPLGS